MAQTFPCGTKGCRERITRRDYGKGKRFHNDECRLSNLSQQPASVRLAADREKLLASSRFIELNGRYKAALTTIETLERERDAVLALRSFQPVVIRPQFAPSQAEGTFVLQLNDWHLEERVDPKTINGLNRFDLDIAEERVSTLFNGVVKLTRILQQDIRVNHMVVGLLGDFISGNIHEEVAEVAQLAPMEAIVFAQDQLIGGIDFLLEHTKFTFHFVCHSGNHGRTTKTTRFATEKGHSLEWLMYSHLAAIYEARGEKRVTFEVADGPHSYVQVYDKTIRFQHGHMVRYNGGVGGIYIPVNKAINEWNKGRRADLDMFGHFHQQADGGNFICGNSLIGYNSFALSIKAPFAPPSQMLTLMNRDRGRTATWPILFKR